MIVRLEQSRDVDRLEHSLWLRSPSGLGTRPSRACVTNTTTIILQPAQRERARERERAPRARDESMPLAGWTSRESPLGNTSFGCPNPSTARGPGATTCEDARAERADGTLQPPKFASLMRSSSENPVILSGIFHGPAPRAHPSAGSSSGSAKSQGEKSTLHSSR